MHPGAPRVRLSFVLTVAFLLAPFSRYSLAESSAPAPELRLPPDVVYQHAVRPDSAVVFRHTTHVAMAGNRCVGCHPAPFHMLRPSGPISHADMDAGRSCGTCHDGHTAFGVKDRSACQSCHTGRPKPTMAATGKGTGGPAVPGLPAPITFARTASPGPVTFRHATHTAGRACTACHPRPYRMKKTVGPPGMAMHESASCGSCHDGKAAFSVENADACARCHTEGAKP
jgi:c(7)-type cytochrome triheme protein